MPKYLQPRPRRPGPEWWDHLSHGGELIERGRGYCKYCHTTHGFWVLPDQRYYQYEGSCIVVCGKCEHSSEAAATGLGKKHWKSKVWVGPDDIEWIKQHRL